MQQTSRRFQHVITLFLLVFLSLGACLNTALFFLFYLMVERYESVLLLQFFVSCLLIFFLASLCSWFLTLMVMKKRWAHRWLQDSTYFDGLTRLPNQQHFLDRVAECISYASRYEHKLAIVFINLDGFDGVNKKLGHRIGDQILQHTADCLRKISRQSDTLARLDKDEFCVLIPRVENQQNIESIAAKIIAALSIPLTIEREKVQIGASLGIAICPSDASSGTELIKKAQAAMALAKQHGPNQYLFHSDTEPHS